MKGDNIFERLVLFGVRTVELIETLPSTPTARHLGQQLVRSATSAGANYQEARGAESRNDFLHKLGVALKELHEAHYWLRLLRGLNWPATDQLPTVLIESQELSRILGSSIRTARSSGTPDRPQQQAGDRKLETGN